MSGGSRFLLRALLEVGPLALASTLVALAITGSAAAALPNTEIYVVNADGTGPVNLTHDPGPDGYPALSPGGSALAFMRLGQLWVMSPDGTGQRALADAGAGRGTGGPVWRPGGLLTFNAAASAPVGCWYKCEFWEIRTVRSDGSGLTTLVPLSSRNPARAPGGRLLAYEDGVYNGEAYGIKVMDTATHQIWTVNGTPTGGAIFSNPQWSPDGGRLAYTRNGRLVVADWQGENRRTLGIGHQAVWAPGGRRLAFVRSRRTESGTTVNAIYVIGARGSGLRRLTRGVLPSWSPNGRRIAFVRFGDLYLMRSDGNRFRLIRRGASSKLGSPVWSHDGRRLFYAG